MPHHNLDVKHEIAFHVWGVDKLSRIPTDTCPIASVILWRAPLEPADSTFYSTEGVPHPELYSTVHCHTHCSCQWLFHTHSTQDLKTYAYFTST